MNFSKNLITLRKNSGLSQKDLAAELGVSQKVIGSYEEGRALARIPTIIQIADYFGITIDRLIRGDVEHVVSILHPSLEERVEKIERILNAHGLYE